MTQIRIKFIVITGLMVGCLSACDTTWQGVYLNSDVLNGRSDGFTPSASSSRRAQNNTIPSQSSTGVAAIESATAVQTTALDTVTEQRDAAVQTVTSQTAALAAPTASAPSFNGGATTVAGLGDPGRAGLWMETPLVSSQRNALITAPNGQSVVVTLEPLSGDQGAGSRLSIGAMRALGLPLTELVKVTVGPV